MSEASWADLADFKASLSPRDVVRKTLEASGSQWISNPRLDPVEELTKLQVLHRPGIAGFSDKVLPREFASYTFRKLLRYLIALHGAPIATPDSIATHLGLGAKAMKQYLEVLEGAGWLNRVGDSTTFTPVVDNLGPTMEWYVAHLFNQYLSWDATTNVFLEGCERGDFDVLAVRSNEIAYVECKTSEPDQVLDDKLANFLDRRDFLEPAFALLLVDTNNSVQDLAERSDAVFWKRHVSSSETRPVTRVKAIESRGSVFSNGTTVYVGNANAGAANGLLNTLRLTLRDYSTRIRGKMVLGRG